MDHQEDELLIALHEAQMVLSEAARPLQELRQEMQQLRHEVRQLQATRTAPLPSWGLVGVVGLGALLLAPMVAGGWSPWGQGARITRTRADVCRDRVSGPA